MLLTDDDGDRYRISTVDEYGNDLDDGTFRVEEIESSSNIYVTAAVLRGLLRAADAAASGVLLD